MLHKLKALLLRGAGTVGDWGVIFSQDYLLFTHFATIPPAFSKEKWQLPRVWTLCGHRCPIIRHLAKGGCIGEIFCVLKVAIGFSLTWKLSMRFLWMNVFLIFLIKYNFRVDTSVFLWYNLIATQSYKLSLWGNTFGKRCFLCLLIP